MPRRPRIEPNALFAGEYRVAQPLYEGAASALYAAERTAGGRVLLRVLTAPLAHDAETARRFARDARATPAVDGRAIAPVLAAGIDADTGLPWVTTAPLSGESLAGAVERSGSVHAADLVEIAAQLRRALAPCHAAGVAHGDLAPDDVFLAVDAAGNAPFELRLLGFGVAAAARRCATDGGSLLWVAPEDVGGDPPRPTSDVWSLGLLAFYALTGATYWHAFAAPRASTPAPLAVDPAHAPLEPATARAARLGLAAMLPSGFDAWFARCVARDAAARYRTADEALGALDAVLSAGISRAFRAPRPDVVTHVPRPSVPHEEPADEPRVSATPAAPTSHERISRSELVVAPADPAHASPALPAPIAPPPAERGSRVALYVAAALSLLTAFGGGVLVGRGTSPARGPRADVTPESEGADLSDSRASAMPPPPASPMPAAPSPVVAPPAALPTAPLPAALTPLPTPPAAHPQGSFSVSTSAGGRIFDNHTTTATVEVTQSCTLASVTLVARGSHTCYSDLIARLRGPHGESVTLQNHAGPSPFRRYTLNRFAGTDPRGTWRFSVTDDVGIDSGYLQGFSLQLSCR